MYNHVEYVLGELMGDLRSLDQKVHCPGHMDDKSSLHVTVRPDGIILLHCFAGCTLAHVLASVNLGVEDLSPTWDGKATASLRDRVYNRYFYALDDLTLEHRKDLTRRRHDFGLFSYRSSRYKCANAACRVLQNDFTPEQLRSTPGFYDGRPAVFTGMVIPVRDWSDRVVALQFRTSRIGEPKYVWLSHPKLSLRPAPFHVASSTAVNFGDAVLVTEGALKADMVNQYASCNVVGLPGVTAWPQLLLDPVFQVFKKVIVAFDQDWLCKPPVREQMRKLLTQLYVRPDIETLVLEWDDQEGRYKGLDDLMADVEDQWYDHVTFTPGREWLSWLEENTRSQETGPNERLSRNTRFTASPA